MLLTSLLHDLNKTDTCARNSARQGRGHRGSERACRVDSFLNFRHLQIEKQPVLQQSQGIIYSCWRTRQSVFETHSSFVYTMHQTPPGSSAAVPGQQFAHSKRRCLVALKVQVGLTPWRLAVAPLGYFRLSVGLLAAQSSFTRAAATPRASIGGPPDTTVALIVHLKQAPPILEDKSRILMFSSVEQLSDHTRWPRITLKTPQPNTTSR